MSRTFGFDDPGNAFRRTDAPAAKQGGLFETDSDDGQNTFTDGQGNKYWFVDTTVGDVTVTLPNAAEVTPDTIFTVKRITAGANNLYVTTGGGLVDGQVSQNIISQYACYSYISDGENYWVSGVGSGEGSISISAMITARLATYITSASVTTALSAYVTSTSLATALGAYVTSGSLATAVGTLLSSSSFATAIAPYVTSASLVTTLGTYVTSGSLATALGTYVTSSSLATALATYATSASVVTSLAAKQPNFNVQDEGVTLTTAAGTVTQINFVGTGISASLTGGILTVTAVAGAGSGEGSVSVSTMISTALGGGYTGTASFAAITLAGRPVGAVLLGYQTLSNVNSFGFSGSWSDFCVLQCQALYRIETGTSATASAAIYSDGGTTPFLNLETASNTQSANQIIAVDYTVYGGNARPIKLMRVNGTTETNLQRVAATATANTAYVNAIKYFSSATMTAGMAVLYGWKAS